MILKILLLLVLMTGPGVRGQAQNLSSPQSRSLESASVPVEGVSSQHIQNIFSQRPDLFVSDLQPPQADQWIRLLMETGDFEQVSAIRDSRGQLKIQARALRRISLISFSGNRLFSERELREMVGLSPNERFSRSRVVEAAERIKEEYGERGFFGAQIEADFKSPEENLLEVHFNIEEGQPCVVKSIRIQGENSGLNSRIQRRVQRYIGRVYTRSLLEDMQARVESYLNENRYLRARWRGPETEYNEEMTEAHLVFQLDHPFRYEILFSGNEHLSRFAVYRILDLRNFDSNVADPGSTMADLLRRHYLAEGFPNIRVDVEETDSPDEFVRRVNLRINEGARVRIREIEVTGRLSRPASYYAQFLRRNSSPLIRRGFYNRQDMEVGYRNLISELRSQGYLRARIQSARLEYLDDLRTTAQIIVLLDEGPLTQVRRIEFVGAEAFSPLDLSEAIVLQTNQAFVLSELEQSLEQLKDFYHRQGFLEMRILNETEGLVEYNERGTQADVQFRILEGPQIRVQSVQVEGNSFTQSRVVTREIAIREGDILTPDKIEESVSRLNRMGIFSRVDISTLEEGTSIADRTVVVHVGERNPGLFRLGGGFVSDSDLQEGDLILRGFTGISYTNLFGRARAVSARVQLQQNITKINYLESEVNLGYMEPFLFGGRTRGRISLTRSEFVFPFIENELATINVSNRLDLLLERDLSRHVKLTWTLWSLDSRSEFERYGRCLDPNGLNCGRQEQQIVTMGPTLDLDYRDNPFLPTQGSYTRFDVDYSSPQIGSSDLIHFIRGEATFTRYFPFFFSGWVFANSLRGGYVANLSRDEGSGVPVSQAFFLGGLSSIRGFGGSNERERIPPNYELPFQRTSQLLISRDSHYGLFRSEMRFPFFAEHGGVVFYDGGFVQVTGFNFSRPFRQAVGFGYRYNTPMGPVALDLAFKINPIRDQERGIFEDPFRIHFSIGTF